MTHQPFFIPSSLICALAIPLILGLIPRNRWYGIRTSQTMSDETVWYRSNRYSGCALLLSGLIYFLIASIFPTSNPHDPSLLLFGIHLLAFALPLAASVLLVRKYVKRLLNSP